MSKVDIALMLRIPPGENPVEPFLTVRAITESSRMWFTPMARSAFTVAESRTLSKVAASSSMRSVGTRRPATLDSLDPLMAAPVAMFTSSMLPFTCVTMASSFARTCEP